MTKTTRLRAAAIAVVGVLTLGVSAPAFADGELPSDENIVAIDEPGADEPLDLSGLVPGDEFSIVVVDPSGTATPVEYGPTVGIGTLATWGACGVFDSNQKLVRTFQRVSGAGLSAGSTYLRCGSEAWGYRHILKNHRTQWEQLSALVGSDWRNFSDWAINQALLYPAYVTYRSSNDTFLYKTQIQIRDSRDRIVSVKYSNVSVARVSKAIITAFPTNS